MEKPRRLVKVQNVLSRARAAIREGRFVISQHAWQRQRDRAINYFDILRVLNTGYHEVKKDEYKPEYNSWNYAIRGKTGGLISARICVAFDKDMMVVVTVTRVDG